jgi:hypothetical protein
MIRIGEAAIYRAYSSTLRLVVKAFAFCAFIRHDIVIIR